MDSLTNPSGSDESKLRSDCEQYFKTAVGQQLDDKEVKINKISLYIYVSIHEFVFRELCLIDSFSVIYWILC